MKMSVSRILGWFAIATISVGLFACEDEERFGVYDSSGGGNVDAGSDAPADAPPDGPTGSLDSAGCEFLCNGDCVPARPAGFSSPRLVWFGTGESQAPACPPHAAEGETLVHAELSVAAGSCSECSCGPSTGSCELPTTITAHAAICNNVEGALALNTDPPASWTGACAPENPIPPGITCNGLPCVQSVTLGQLAISNESCTSLGTSTTPLPAPTWQLVAKICEGSAFGTCTQNEQCAPAQAQGFSHCIEHAGNVPCPAEGYTVRHVYFDGLADTRACSPCGCGKPEGSFCAAEISLYKDSACTAPVLTADAWSGYPLCHDMGPPVASVGAKSASEPVYTPGVCEAFGGELLGEVTPQGARTLCCVA